MAPVPASPVLDCSDSGLSVTANVIGILTFVAALTLAAQLSLVEARRWLDHENFVIRIRSKEISDKIGRASKEVEDLGSQTLLQRFSQKSWYTDAMRRSDDTRIHHLQSLKSVCSNWWRDHKMLSDEVSSVVQFGFRIHRPLLWLARRRDQWLRAETEKLRKRLLYLENKLRFIDEYYPLSREPIDPDL